MSRMLNPDPGEVVDRQTILELKMEHGQSIDEPKLKEETKEMAIVGDTRVDSFRVARTKVEGASKINIKPFSDEHEVLQRYLEKNWFPLLASPCDQGSFDKLYDTLHEVNSDLWKLEDQVRIYIKAPIGFEAAADVRSLEVYRTITTLNDRRAELVKQINALWKLNTQEKLF